MAVVLCLNDGNWNIGLVEKNIIGPLVLGAGVQLTANDYPPFGKRKFFSDLGDNIPPSPFKSRSDVFSTDIAFGERFLIHASAFLLPVAFDKTGSGLFWPIYAVLQAQGLNGATMDY